MKYIIPAIWIASLTLPAHLCLTKIGVGKYSILNDTKTYVRASAAVIEGAIVASLGYVIPHVVMVIMYSLTAYKLWTRRVPCEEGEDCERKQAAARRTARKVSLMIVCVLFIFNVCWLPAFYQIFFVYFIPVSYALHDPLVLVALSIVATSNGLLNAVIYTVICEKYRAAFKDVFSFLKLDTCTRGSRNRPNSGHEMTRRKNTLFTRASFKARV